MAVGIDLGTTNSAIAGVNEYGRPEIIPNAEGQPTTPSVICFKDGGILIGQEAKEYQELGLYPIAAFFKRQMGNEHFVVHADGRDYSAIDLSALIIGKLKRDAEARLGEPVSEAVITVPAYFRDPERKATLAAGKQAGLAVRQVINEPTAAAIAYGLGQPGREQQVLVYDLGGGTFDVTLLQLGSQGIRVLSSEGDHQLGGKDFDDRLMQYLASRFQDEFGSDPLADAESFADLLVRVETSKKQLSELQSSTISIVHEGDRGRYRLDRTTFEELTRDLLERTRSMTARVLEDMRLETSAVDGVLLVGGSTRMPMVHDLVAGMFGRPPLTGISVDEAVALGAALVAGAERAGEKPTFGLAGPTVDVTNHSLGMIALNADRSAYVNTLILPKNRPIPCSEDRPYLHRSRPGSNQLEVYVTQGESESPGDVVYLGRYLLHDLPHSVSGPTVVDITYSYDVSGTVSVDGAVEDTPLRVTVENLPGDVPDRFLRPPEESFETEHVTAYLAFDLSGSMRGAPLEAAKKAAGDFLKGSDLSHCSLGIIAFSDRVKTKLEASQNARKIEAAIRDLHCGETGYGNATDPFREIGDLLGGVSGARFVVVLADGVWARQGLAAERAKTCHGDGIEVIAVGFGGADRDFLRDIASTEETSFFTTVGGLAETYSTIAQVITARGGLALAPQKAAATKSRVGRLLGRLKKA